MTLYTIKPLQWRKLKSNRWVADTPFGQLRAFVSTVDGVTKWDCWASALPRRCDSIEDGKERAEAYYREQLAGALEAVGSFSHRDEAVAGMQVGGVHYDPAPDHDRPPGSQRP